MRPSPDSRAGPAATEVAGGHSASVRAPAAAGERESADAASARAQARRRTRLITGGSIPPVAATGDIIACSGREALEKPQAQRGARADKPSISRSEGAGLSAAAPASGGTASPLTSSIFQSLGPLRHSV
jgi:hypothetical protein